MMNVPVITIDGPAGAGKSTVSRLLSQRLHYHILVSGFLYRAVAWLSIVNKTALDDLNGLIRAVAQCRVDFQVCGGAVAVHFEGRDISDTLIEESCGERASRLAEIPAVRARLLDYQRSFRRLPGLVADGRDMATIVFPDANLKIFLTADLAARARRRYGQLNHNGFNDSLAELKQQLQLRDERDSKRATAPLAVACDAVVIDTTHKTADAVVNEIAALLLDCLIKN